MSARLIPTTACIVALLDHANGRSDHETAMRLMKVAEELGEATAAYIGMTGQNPRKGVTHSREDVAKELVDVIISATIALHGFTDDPAGMLDDKLRISEERLTPAAPAAPGEDDRG